MTFSTAPSRVHHRLDRGHAGTLQSWRPRDGRAGEARDVVVDCGWGRMVFAHTFDDPASVCEVLRQEAAHKRDIAFYVRDPHVLLAMAPQELFLDPSHTYRLWFDRYRPARNQPRGFAIRRVRTPADAAAMNRVYARCHMVAADEDFIVRHRKARHLSPFVAVSGETGEVIGCVTGLDHVACFDDPEGGSSLWSLAVDPQAAPPRVGEALVRHLAEHYAARGRAYMDLSVLHDNRQAIALYEKLEFARVPVFCVKRKNPINEPLFVVHEAETGLNPYALIIVEEARRRGIMVEVLDAEAGFFRLSHGGRMVTCREALSELTTAVAMSRCDDKQVTRRLLRRAGLQVPEQVLAGGGEADARFLAQHGRVVVKPAHGEQGRGVFVDLSTPEEVEAAVEAAGAMCPDVLIERYVEGEDLRIVVIDYKVVAAAIRRPALVIGNGQQRIRELIEKQSRRRAAATGGESRIPMDSETERCVAAAGFALDDVLDEGQVLAVRKSANLHTGGTIHDVTDELHPRLAEAAVRAAEALEIPVVGLDLIVDSASERGYVIIEANERPGLANHEPQPTAERFVDLLFPDSARQTHGGNGDA